MLKLHEKSGDDTVALMADIGRHARAAARPLAIATTAAKNAALVAMAEAIVAREQEILDANAIDVLNGEQSGLSASFMDRLRLNAARIRAMADGIREIAELRDPVGDVIAEWDRPNGLTSNACARRLASSASSMRAGRTSPRMPARCASRPAIR